MPFDLEHLHHHPDGTLRLSSDITRDATAWLLRALREAGVTTGSYDCEVARVIAEEGTTLVQVVAGWVARAKRGQ